MAYPDNLLVTGERVIVNKRPHWKVLILPTILFIVIIGAGVRAGRVDQQPRLGERDMGLLGDRARSRCRV